MPRISFAVPKGSLERATFELLEAAWYGISGRDRSYRPSVSDPDVELKLLRPQEIPLYVADSTYDLGITGYDWIKESRANVKQLLSLGYGRIRLVCASPANSPWSTVDEILEAYAREGRTLRVSTEYLNISSEFIMSLPSYRAIYGSVKPLSVTPWSTSGENPKVVVYLSFGATEAKPPDEADIIVDVTETGKTLEENGLKINATIMESEAVLISNSTAMRNQATREKIADVLALLRGVVEARKRLHIFVNVKETNLKELLSLLPSLKGPTVSKLSTEGWYSVNTVIHRQDFIKLLPGLRRLAQGLVVHQPHQILPLDDVLKEDEYGAAT